MWAFLVAQWQRIARQCRRHGFSPWPRKSPRATERLSPCAATAEPALHEKGDHRHEKPAHRTCRAAPTRHNWRKARAAMKTGQSQREIQRSLEKEALAALGLMLVSLPFLPLPCAWHTASQGFPRSLHCTPQHPEAATANSGLSLGRPRLREVLRPRSCGQTRIRGGFGGEASDRSLWGSPLVLAHSGRLAG